MEPLEMLSIVLDNWHKPLIYVDCNHIICYLNKPAKKKYAKYGDVIGKCLLDCHNENSCRLIQEGFARLQTGTEEVLLSDTAKSRYYIHAVRDEEGHLLGYYDRYDPPAST